jgi:bifunctional non-homologous end joining protein LigD
MIRLFDAVSREARPLLRKARHPAWVPPMLATLKDKPFSDKAWVFERKFDGVRILAFRNGSSVRLLTRNRLPANEAYPAVADAIANEALGDFVVDGEVVAFEGKATSFSLLQRRMQLRDASRERGTGVRIYYYVFDIMHAAGYDTRVLPLLERKKLLRAALSFRSALRFSTHRPTRGEALLDEACSNGWEGIIAKRADSVYVPKRSTDWLKLKCSLEQELVVVGFTDPRGSRLGFGALLLGYYENGRLRYAGDVGTGFDHQTLQSLRRTLSRLEVKRPPVEGDSLPRNVHWVRPRLVAQVAFTEWTRDGKLRHPRFKGLRRDKEAREVVRERPA